MREAYKGRNCQKNNWSTKGVSLEKGHWIEGMMQDED
jgi:hypothetical protein